MEKDELLEENTENKIPGAENESVEAETGTAESDNEAVAEDTPVEENVDNGNVEEAEPEQEQEQEQAVEEPVADEQAVEEPVADEPVEQEKMLTQSQVNELVGKARAEGRASAMKELYERYGVSDDNEMNDIFGKGQGYDVLNDEYTSLNGKYGDMAAENALLKSGISANCWDDVKAILGYKGMDITVENIQSELATHPYWQSNVAEAGAENKEITPEMAESFAEKTKPVKAAPSQTSTIRKLGSNVPESKVDLEENEMMKVFGLK